MAARDQLIVALDYAAQQPALQLVDTLGDTVLWYKVGLELFLAEGAPIVQALRERGKRVFLDLKLHDIPNTVAGAIRSLSRLEVDLMTVHASGGPLMLRAAVDAAGSSAHGTRVLAVTVLTSMDKTQLGATGIRSDSAAQVVLLGQMAMTENVAGLVCSAEEIVALRNVCGDDPLLVVPGIRGRQDAMDDQRRTASAEEAIDRGASMLVVGRPITRAADPTQVARTLLNEMEAPEV